MTLHYLVKAASTISAQLRESGKWHSVGTGVYTDPYIRSLNPRYLENYEGEWTGTWNVQVEESNSTPGFYRIVNPYGVNSPCKDLEYVDQDITATDGRPVHFGIDFDHSGNDYYLFIHTENPDKMWAETTYTGYTNWYGPSSNDRLYEEKVQYDNCVGTTHLGGSYTDYFYKYGTSELKMVDNKHISSSYNFELLLPGYIDHSYKFSFSDRSITLRELGDGVSELRYTIAPKGDGTEEYYFNLLATNSADIIIGRATATGAIDLTPFNIAPEKPYILYSVAMDAEGGAHMQESQTFAIQAHEYNFFGIGEMREGIDMLFGQTPNPYQVEIFTADDAPGVYFVKNPHRSPYIFGGYLTDQSYDRYMAIDCSNPARVSIPEYDTGLDLGYGNIFIASIEPYAIESEVDPATLSNDYFGQLVDREITFQSYRLMRMTNYQNGKWVFDTSAEFYLRLPGFKDYTFAITSDNGDDVYITNIGADVDHIIYTVGEASATTPDELIAALESGQTDTQTIESEGLIDLSYWNMTIGKEYYVAAASVDVSGVAQKAQHVTIYCEPDYTFLCKGTMVDPMPMMFNVTIEEVETSVYTVDGNQEILYVDMKEPNPNENNHTPNRMLAINCSDPNRIYIIPWNYGFYLRNSTWIYYSSMPGLAIDSGASTDSYTFGKLIDNVITIPADELCYALTDDTFMKLTSNVTDPESVPDFTLKLNGLTGIGNITADGTDENAKTEYFDISGRPVTNPGTGIYIVRRGSRVSKEAIRR